MRFDSEIYLLSIEYTTNEMGDSIENEAQRMVFAEKISIRQTEFYQAAANGFKPQLGFKTWIHEYDGESVLSYKGVKYSIIRTYSKNRKEIEIICEGVVNDGTT